MKPAPSGVSVGLGGIVDGLVLTGILVLVLLHHRRERQPEILVVYGAYLLRSCTQTRRGPRRRGSCWRDFGDLGPFMVRHRSIPEVLSWCWCSWGKFVRSGAIDQNPCQFNE